MQVTGTENRATPPPIRFFDRFASPPLRIAHRGYRACYPENTLCAFEQSLGRCRMIELDVQLCRDGVVVVFHDHDLTRTTNAAWLARKLDIDGLNLCDWRLEQLRQLDIGSWFLSADPFGTLRKGWADRTYLASLMPQRILTLRELLVWAEAKRMLLNIEIKNMRHTRMEGLLVPEVIREIRKAGASERVILSSFNHEYLTSSRQLAPEIATAALQEEAHPADLVRYLQTLGVSAYHPEYSLVDEVLVKTLRAAGLAVNVFTVNDPARQQQLFCWGVTGIFTDFLCFSQEST